MLFIAIFRRLTNTFIVLFFIEILSWIFLFIMPIEIVIGYLLIQAYFLIIRLSGIIISRILLALALRLKLGLPPFHSWVLRVSERLEKSQFVFITTLHKIYPIFFICLIILNIKIFLYLSFILIFSTILLINIGDSFIIFVFSSIAHRCWILFSRLVRKGFLIVYWRIYRILIVLFVRSLIRKTIKGSLDNNYSVQLSWFILSGFPPFVLFWIKINLFLEFLKRTSLFYRTVLTLTRVIALSCYYRNWHVCSTINKKNINNPPLSGLFVLIGIGFKIN